MDFRGTRDPARVPAQACAFLAQHGLTEVYNLRGGVSDWVQAGLDLKEPKVESVHVL